MEDTIKQLKIKTGSVGRLRKELTLYKEEERKEQENVLKLKSTGADEHDIKHAVSLP
jgi:tubulin-specific chaperone A